MTNESAGSVRRPATPDHLAEKIRSARGRLEGERKQVTVLFADVVGSMELAERVDPETWQEVMNGAFSIMCEGVHRFEGTVDKFTGDGIMAIFGAPIAHEDHARRACYAALQLQTELIGYAAVLRRQKSLNFSVRMGLNSGEVVVGSIGNDLGMEYTAVGHTVGLAQRMEQLAEPGKVYLAEPAADLAEGYFRLDDLGDFEIKGARGATRVHELTGVGTARGRLDISRSRGFSRFVGRNEEMEIVEEALEHSFEGRPQVIGIVGEPGVGKSRLCEELARRCREKGIPVYHAAGQAHAKSVPLLPVLQLMRAYFDVSEVESGQTARERIAGKLVLLDEGFRADLPLIFDFLGVPDPERPSPQMDPEARRRQVLEMIDRLTHAQSARQPGLVVVEDLHWVDPETEAFLAHQVEASQGTRSLMVLNYRPGYQASWMSRSFYRQVALTPLGDDAIAEMLNDLLGSDESLAGLGGQIRERTGGNPFFLEEVVQSLVEAGNLQGEAGSYELVRPVDYAAVPASVQAVLSARIDRLLQRDKEVLQTAAVVGREFSESVLARVLEADAMELEDALRALVGGEFIYQQELYPEALYSFKHPLTQEVAYGSQLGRRRAAVHAAVARALAEQRSDRLDENAALLAHHWEAAGEPLEAARWHARAAAWSGFGDQTASLRHWRRVLGLTASLPQSEETQSLGLTARIFSLQYGWRLGIAPEEAEVLFREAEGMASAIGDVRSRASLLVAYGTIRGMGEGDAEGAAKLAREAIDLAEDAGDPELHLSIVVGSYALIVVGAFREAKEQLDRALEMAAGNTKLAAGAVGGSPYAYCLIFSGGYLISLGEWQEAARLLEAGMQLGGEEEDFEVVGWGHLWSSFLAYFRGEKDAMIGHARQALEIAERSGGAFSRAWAWHFFGEAEGVQENWEPAIEAMERGLAISREGRTAVLLEPLSLAARGECLLGLGDRTGAREATQRAVEVAAEWGADGLALRPNITSARVLLADSTPEADAEAQATLEEGLRLVAKTEAKAWTPMIRIGLAEVAGRRGDTETQETELREAQRLYREMGAPALAEELEDQIPAPAG
jgi:class 3 adenylate cyclase/tetratricopeptide (TPR) repeat protein